MVFIEKRDFARWGRHVFELKLHLPRGWENTVGVEMFVVNAEERDDVPYLRNVADLHLDAVSLTAWSE